MKNVNVILITIISALLLSLTRLNTQLHFLVFVAFVPLMLLFDHKFKKRQIGLSAATFTVTYLSVVLHWITLVTFGGYFAMFILFFIYFSFYFMLIYFFGKFFPKLKFLSFLIFWTCFELFQGIGPFKFPWFNLGYSITEYRPLIQLADIGGNTLLGIMILIINYLIYSSIRKFRKRKVLSILMIFLVWFTYGFYRIKTIEITQSNKKIGIVQASFSQKEKWDKNKYAANLEIYKNFSLQAKEKGANLIIWPESAITSAILRNYFLKNSITNFCEQNDIQIFSGFPHYIKKNDQKKYYYYNSCSLISENIEKPYFKHKLVPFGEEIPFAEKFPVLENLVLGQANFTPGKELKTYKYDNLTFSPLICFEIAFPQLLLKNLKYKPDFFVNLTNDAWYKRSIGTYQHAEFAKIRAIETRKTIIRVANTGISLIADPTGKIIDKLNLYEKDILISNIPLTTAKSLYAILFKSYEKIILLIGIIMALLTIYKLKFI